MGHRAKVLGAVALLLLLGVYVVHKLASSPEWQQFQGSRFWQSLAQLRWSYLLLGAALIFASYFFRSLRWRAFLLPMKKGSLDGIFASTLIGFSAVALMGRPGEFVRPWLIARKERLDVSSQLGAWTLERLFDGLTLGALLGAALLLFPPDLALSAGGSQAMTHLQTGGMVLGGSTVLLAALLAQLRYNRQASIRFFRWLARWLPERYRERLQKVLEGFSGGLASIESVSSFLASVGYSLLVWGTLVLTYWSVTQAFGWPMTRLGLGAVVLVLAIGLMGSLAQIPGIGGGTQVATLVALTELFGIPLEVASSAAIFFWVLTYMIVLVPGLPLAAREGLTWQRLRNLARSPRTVGAQ